MVSLLQNGVQAAEVKITIIYAYFVVFLAILISQEAVVLAERDSYRDAVDSYFLCEAVGHMEGRCSRESFEQYSHPLLDIARYIALTLLPVAVLLYLINCRSLRAKVKEMKVIKVVRSFSLGQPSTSLTTS